MTRSPAPLPFGGAAWVALAAALVAAAACGGGTRATGPATSTSAPVKTGGRTGSPPTTAAATAPATAPDLGAVKARLEQVAALSSPTALAVRPGDDALYVAEKGGRLRQVAHGQGPAGSASLVAAPVLDLSDQVTTGFEQGLLGVTFSRDAAKLYVDYTDRAGDTQVVEYAFAAGRADPSTRRTVLTVHQPYANHNGGEVAFGPDGKLYVGLGDGGSEYDPDNRGQDLTTLLAKILRIDPAPSGGKGYSVPPDNPLVGRTGARPETFQWGLRNPWRFTWDRLTSDLWIGDVGQDKWEEVDFRAASSPAGANFGWSLMEGSHQFKGKNPPDGVLPIAEYSHDQGCSVTGGYVYRGTRIPALAGAYLYGDYCSGRTWALVQSGGTAVASRPLDIGTQGSNILSFGEDSAGELYVLTDAGVSRIVPG